MPAYYRALLDEFLADDSERILGVLAAESAKSGFADLKQKQTKAWQKQIKSLKSACFSLQNQFTDSANWGVLLEYPIPRRQKRIDAVLLARRVISPNAISGDTSVAGHRLFTDGNCGLLKIRQEQALHLEVNLRSFRARRLAEWVDAVLNGNAFKAAGIVADLKDFPVTITRSLTTARTWLRERARGLRRCGLVASSGAIRLRAEGLELSSGFRQGNRDLYVQWFLADPSDIRSSNQLEIAASEFECQGLELDWVGLCWGGDFTFSRSANSWVYRRFSGSRWGNIAKDIDREYLLNTYRVLLTRAREGMVIWVPTGDGNDQTRRPMHFDETAEYLKQCGLPLF